MDGEELTRHRPGEQHSTVLCRLLGGQQTVVANNARMNPIGRTLLLSGVMSSLT
jgi:hypothetical protein